MNIPYPRNITDLEDCNLATYILVDCAHFELKFYKNLYKEDKLNFKSLFLGTPDELSAFAGPVLIQVDQYNDKNFISKVLKAEQEKPAVVWLWSEKNLKKYIAYFNLCFMQSCQTEPTHYAVSMTQEDLRCF